MKKRIPAVSVIMGVLLIGIAAAMLSPRQQSSFKAESVQAAPVEKLYVAVEGDGKVAVIDPNAGKVLTNIDLSRKQDGEIITMKPHNVQVSPDRKSVWVTVNHEEATHEHGMRLIPQASAHEGMGMPADGLVIIDPMTDKIVGRVPIKEHSNLAHVVLPPDGRYAYVVSTGENALYKVDTQSFTFRKIEFPDNSGPHGLRISPDGKKAYIAMMDAHAFGVVDLMTDSYHAVPLSGSAVQTGVTPDGRFAFASVYQSKTVALYDVRSGKVQEIPLPKEARGPVQVYPSPDSRFIYVADQGYYFDQPIGEKVFKIDIARKSIEAYQVGKAPHGVVSSSDGERIFITNLLSGDVSVIDTTDGREVARIPVGTEPNGITLWHE